MHIEDTALLFSKNISEGLELDAIDEKKVYYGILLMLLSGIKILFLFAVSILIHCFVQCLLIVIVYAAFKSLTGGYHCDRYYKCLISGMILFNGAAYISKNMNFSRLNVLVFQLLATYLFSYLCFTIYPIENPIKPLKVDKDRIRKILVASLIIYNIIFFILFLWASEYAKAWQIGFCLNILFSLPFGKLILNIFNIVLSGGKVIRKEVLK